MNLTQLERKLIAAARSNPPGDAVPYAFEKRVMAALQARPAADHWADWSQALWRAVAPCVGIMLLLGAWSFVGEDNSGTGDDVMGDFETTVLAAVEPDSNPDGTW